MGRGEAPAPAPDAALLAAYAATRWIVALPGGAVTVSLHRPAPSALRPSAIVTAFNPASRRRSARANARADAALRGHADRLGIARHPAEAVPADGADEWREPGHALTGIARGEAAALGARFGQNAVVWIEPDGAVLLLAARDGFCGQPAGGVVAAPPANEGADLDGAPH